MVKWRGNTVTYSVTPDHLVCLLKIYLCWQQQSQHTVNLSMNVKAVLSQPSCLTSGAVLMGRQHPPLFLHSERCRWDEAEGITAVLQGGSWLSSRLVSGPLAGLLIHFPLWGGRLLFLSSEILWIVLSVCHFPLHQHCDFVFFCRLVCCCLGVGLRHWLHLPMELHSGECSSVACASSREACFTLLSSVCSII